MSDDGLSTYRAKRDAARTPEPVPPPGPVTPGTDDTFVVQEHHATALHWDVRLERGGVLVSWAVPKGLPLDPTVNRLAVQTEDHPLSYADFEGRIGQGEYGGGGVTIWDRGTYETEEWSEGKVKVVLHGSRVEGRYVLFRTGGKNWMVHRMSPLPDGWEPLPARVPPMTATPADGLPGDDEQWAYEMRWGGLRAAVHVEGGRATAWSLDDVDITDTYPELRAMAESMGATQAVLDGVLVALDPSGRPDPQLLRRRMNVSGATRIRRLAGSVPVTYLIVDVLHLDGRSTLSAPYRERRALLDELALSGPTWRTPPAWFGGGPAVLAAAREQQVGGVVAKQVESAYEPGARSRHWLEVTELAG
jgi:bifunctional non-homologous end joining protein LigD